MKQIGIIGNSGQARELLQYLQDEQIQPIFTALGDKYLDGSPAQIDILQPTDEQKDIPVVIAVGSPALKRDMASQWPGSRFETITSARSYIATTARIRPGSVIAPFASVGPDTDIGEHVLVNISASVAHDCAVGSYATISPGVNIGGGVTVGEGCFIGIGATIKNNVTVASGVVIGAGAVVVKDIVESNTVVAGVPAKTIKRNEDWLYAI